MRVLYVSLSYVPSRRASSVQVMKMCAAMARLGHDVILIAKWSDERGERGVADDHAFYGVEPTFRINKLPRPAQRGGGLVYAGAAALAISARRRWADLVYCRDIAGAVVSAALGMPVVFEAHELPQGKLQTALWRRVLSADSCVGLVAISQALKRDLEAAGLAGRGRIIVAHDAADGAVRPVRSGWPATEGPPKIGYVGNLYRGRGIDLLLEVSRRMPDCSFELVGGTETDIDRWRAAAPPPNVHFRGFRPPSQLGVFYGELDVVVMPHSRAKVVGAAGHGDISRWTSPMKMFEYMASGVPLVASDLPVLGEVLEHGRNALIARSDDPDDWVAKIHALLDSPILAARLAKSAQEDLLRSYTWDARAQRVLDGLTKAEPTPRVENSKTARA